MSHFWLSTLKSLVCCALLSYESVIITVSCNDRMDLWGPALMCGRSFEELFHPTSCLIPVVTSSFVATQLKHSSAVDSLSLAAPLLVLIHCFCVRLHNLRIFLSDDVIALQWELCLPWDLFSSFDCSSTVVFTMTSECTRSLCTLNGNSLASFPPSIHHVC